MVYRQGDVLIEQVKSIPRGVKRQKHTTLALGEATGHHHTAYAVVDAEPVTMFEDSEGTLWLRVQKSGAEVRHQEHGTIPLPSGNYRVTRQREYSPERIRQVVD